MKTKLHDVVRRLRERREEGALKWRVIISGFNIDASFAGTLEERLHFNQPLGQTDVWGRRARDRRKMK